MLRQNFFQKGCLHINHMNFENKKVAIIGLGVEGKDALRFLINNGANVVVLDKKEKGELDLTGVGDLDFQLVCGKNYLKNLTDFDVIVRSPGVRPDLPEIIDAVNNGTQLTSAINIFFLLCPSPIIGVTGTKGKGTTATLIYECLKASGKSVCVAGNIGKPCLALLSQLKDSDIVVLELSSFQLIDIRESPHVAIVLNITTDHLDWHPHREEYVLSKQNIVKFQKRNDFAVLAKDYKNAREMSSLTKSKVYYFSTKEEVEGAYVLNGEIILNIDDEERLGRVGDLLLRGEHNWENIAAAAVASKIAGATTDGIKAAVFSFPGLEHRLEFVGTFKGVSFYNDSFATSPLPSLAAVKAFSEPVVLILGGSRKGFRYDEFGRNLSKQRNLKSVIVIGETGPEIKEALIKNGLKGNVVEGGRNMEQIVGRAYKLAKPGDVVLLSPAAASFDMFKDYKDRGEQFRREVMLLNS